VYLLVMGLSDKRLLDAYNAVLEALRAKHGNSPFWRTVKAEAIPLL